ncbi:GTPase domain-containing protein [Legionella rowbothamii]|uniref:GTPase domain-containing protein n=1 Tax=Legionella rowbothamii TaxID=96229 RepID=UPI0010542AE2|nr:GTPase domain-containing protein [Legionella rowbothamii]
MKQYKVVLMGAECAGKSELFRRLVYSQKYRFNAVHQTTLGTSYGVKYIANDHELHIWELSGAARFCRDVDILSYAAKANVALLCINLTQEINQDQILKKIEEFSIDNPYATLFLVGTQSDHPQARIQEFRQLNLDKKIFITSAKDGLDIDVLLQAITDACGIPPLKKRWDDEISNLLAKMSQLPNKEYDAITQELNLLEQIVFPTNVVENANNELKQEAIKLFQKKCQSILRGNYSEVWNALLTVVAAAVVTTLTAMLGFAIGLALGAWTGPGAFITALVGAKTAAASVVGASATFGVGAALTSYGLFKEQKKCIENNVLILDLPQKRIASLFPSIIN